MKKHAMKFGELLAPGAVLLDCCMSDVLVTDGTGELTRPEICVAMDVYSKAIVALTIRLAPRNGGNHGHPDIDDA
ncbi:hypothetical protein [Cupriavidus sp. CP313]